jgi:hypothetical protein
LRNIDELFTALGNSTFRRRFHLRDKDLLYLQDKGLSLVLTHADDFIAKRLAPAIIHNDGKQTPFRGHPVLSPSLLRLAAVAAALRSGTVSHLEGNSVQRKKTM